MAGRVKGTEEWQAIIKEFMESGQSEEEYCRQNSILPRTFRRWHNKLNLISRQKTRGERFVSFKIVQTNAKVSLPNGINVEVATQDVIGLIKALTNVV